jgi:hypothetical protein
MNIPYQKTKGHAETRTGNSQHECFLCCFHDCFAILLPSEPKWLQHMAQWGSVTTPQSFQFFYSLLCYWFSPSCDSHSWRRIWFTVFSLVLVPFVSVHYCSIQLWLERKKPPLDWLKTLSPNRRTCLADSKEVSNAWICSSMLIFWSSWLRIRNYTFPT